MIQLLAVLALSPILIVINGFVIQHLWGWFVVTTFALAPLSIPAAIGIALVAHYVTWNYSGEHNVGSPMITTLMIRPGVVLLTGYIVHLFM